MSVEKYQQFIKSQLQLSGSDFFRRQEEEYQQQQKLWKEQLRQQALQEERVDTQQHHQDSVNLSQLFKIRPDKYRSWVGGHMKQLHTSHDSQQVPSKQIVMNQQDVQKLEVKIEKTHRLFYVQQFSTKSPPKNNHIYSLDRFKKQMFSRQFDQMNESKLQRHRSKYQLHQTPYMQQEGRDMEDKAPVVEDNRKGKGRVRIVDEQSKEQVSLPVIRLKCKKTPRMYRHRKLSYMNTSQDEQDRPT